MLYEVSFNYMQYRFGMIFEHLNDLSESQMVPYFCKYSLYLLVLWINLIATEKFSAEWSDFLDISEWWSV